MEHVLGSEHEQQHHLKRRLILQAAIGVGTGLTLVSTLYVGAGLVPKKKLTPETEPIAAGDWLVYAMADRKGQPILANDLQIGQLQTIAFPMNPQTKVVKSAEVKNTVVLIKLEPSSLSPTTTQYAANDIVAYSAICSHLGCTVSLWFAQQQVMQCPCHGGRYDPKDGAKVVVGPPIRALPQLPIKTQEGRIVVTGGFLGKVGPG